MIVLVLLHANLFPIATSGEVGNAGMKCRHPQRQSHTVYIYVCLLPVHLAHRGDACKLRKYLSET